MFTPAEIWKYTLQPNGIFHLFLFTSCQMPVMNHCSALLCSSLTCALPLLPSQSDSGDALSNGSYCIVLQLFKGCVIVISARQQPSSIAHCHSQAVFRVSVCVGEEGSDLLLIHYHTRANGYFMDASNSSLTNAVIRRKMVTLS